MWDGEEGPVFASDYGIEQIPLLSGIQVTTRDDQYTGHYAKYNVPVKFQKLALEIYNLHKTLNSEKYWICFFHIQEALNEYNDILQKNDLSTNIDLRVANLSTIIQAQLNIIVDLKKTIKNQSDFIDTVSNIKLTLNTLKNQFVLAINGYKDSITSPPPISITSSQHLQSPSQIATWVEEIGELPSPEPFYRIFDHTFFYMQKTAIIAISFFAFSISAAIQSTFDYVLTDLGRKPHPDQSAALDSFVHMALPIIAFSIGIALSIYAIVQTKKFHKERRQEHLKKANHIDSGNTLPTQVETSPITSPSFLVPSAQSSIPRFFSDPRAQNQQPLEARARCAYEFIHYILNHDAGTFDEEGNPEQKEACATMRCYLADGRNSTLRDQIDSIMTQNNINKVPAFAQYYSV